MVAPLVAARFHPDFFLPRRITMLRIITLRDSIPWFGKYTGYEYLPSTLGQFDDITVMNVVPKKNLLRRLVGKTYSTVKGWPPRNQYHAAAELEFSLRARFGVPDVLHVLYLEQHLRFIASRGSQSIPSVGTIHQPPSRWDDQELKKLTFLSKAILLYRRDLAFFENYVGEGNVEFIRHGVDVNFFCPDDELVDSTRVLYVGHHLRNMNMLQRVATRLLDERPDVQLDCLLPPRFRTHPALRALGDHARVHWLSGLSDEELRTLYQRSCLLLLPMNDSGANTAVVEALGCGLPIVTCDVGGIRDYGGGDLFPVVANDDDDAMLKAVMEFLDVPEQRNEVGRACRAFATSELSWPHVARQHATVYRSL